MRRVDDRRLLVSIESQLAWRAAAITVVVVVAFSAGAAVTDVWTLVAVLTAVTVGTAVGAYQAVASDEVVAVREPVQSEPHAVRRAGLLERDAAEERRRQLALAAAHDVRTPLTSLTLLASAMRDGFVSRDELAEHADRMLRQVGLVERLTDEIFGLARLEVGDVRWTMVDTRIGELVPEVIAQLKADADERRIELVGDVSDAPTSALVAPERIVRVLVNLVQNALQHTPPGGRVAVRVRAAAGLVVVDVADTGSGIAPEHRMRIFEPFFRGDPENVRHGCGVGLAIARLVVDAHGGQLGLVDAEIGTCVRLTLPTNPCPD